jgi:hypothetical protein
MLSAQMRELLRRADVLGIESDIIEKGRRLNAQTVVRMERRRELAQFASSTDLEELENQVRSVALPLIDPPSGSVSLCRLNEQKMRVYKKLPSFLTSIGS